MDTVVRTAYPEEAGLVARLQRTAAIAGYRDIFPTEAAPPSLAEIRAQWDQWLAPAAARASRVFVAVDGDTVAGVVLAGTDPADDRMGHVARLYVAPSRWGRGIGRMLHDAAVAHVTTVGFDVATLWVLEHNQRARSWYERLGWRPTGERRTVYAPAGIDDLRYRIVLG